MSRAFCSGLTRAKIVVSTTRGAECVVVECGDICSGHRGADVEAEVTTDLLGDDGIVAGDDLDGDAEVGESLEGCGGIEFGWSKKTR